MLDSQIRKKVKLNKKKRNQKNFLKYDWQEVKIEEFISNNTLLPINNRNEIINEGPEK